MLVSEDVFISFEFSMQLFRYSEDDLGASLSAAQAFFDLFDRTPAIDNCSLAGHEIVSTTDTLYEPWIV